jgi:hypothetical protein
MRPFVHMTDYRNTLASEPPPARNWTSDEIRQALEFDRDLPTDAPLLSQWLGMRDFRQALGARFDALARDLESHNPKALAYALEGLAPPPKRVRRDHRPDPTLNALLDDFYRTGDPLPIMRARRKLRRAPEVYLHEIAQLCERLPDLGHPMSAPAALVYAALSGDACARRAALRKLKAVALYAVHHDPAYRRACSRSRS